MLSSGVLPAFALHLKDLIDARFKSRREFIRATRAANEDGAQAYLTKVVKGAKPPPIDRLPAWADALELYGEDRQRFMDLAAIAHLPVEVQPRFINILRQLQTAQADVRAINSRLDALESQRNGVSKK